jgi:hypothetical protein
MADALNRGLEDQQLLACLAADGPAPLAGPGVVAGPTPNLFRRHRPRLDALLCRLAGREYHVLELLFGLDGREPQAPALIGARLGLDEEQVDAYCQGALRRLRSMEAPATVLPWSRSHRSRVRSRPTRRPRSAGRG